MNDFLLSNFINLNHSLIYKTEETREYFLKKLYDNDFFLQILSSYNNKVTLKDEDKNYNDYILPIVYGTVNVKGVIIWYEKYESNSIEYIDLAVAICEGKIDSINKIYIDNKTIEFDNINLTIYKGEDAQDIDSILQDKINSMPAYNKLAYIVIQGMEYPSSSNKLPEFLFEVTRNRSIVTNNNIPYVADLITSVCIGPSTGEFIYDKNIVTRNNNDGTINYVNQNTDYHTMSDATVSLNNIKRDLPNIKWITLELSWFCNKLIVDSNFTINPCVELKNCTTEGREWMVAGFTRDDFEVTTLLNDHHNNLNYGGTCSDDSVLSIVDDLRERGYKIFIQPKILVNSFTKDHCSSITCDANNDISYFFDPYKQFIIHYANLLKDKIDAFAIGYALKGITNFKDSKNNYIAINEFISLTQDVRDILGGSVLLTYSADWDEYHAYNTGYHMDYIWSDKNIDFIGINAYFPLTDIKNQTDVTIEDCQKGWDEGIFYDYYYYTDDLGNVIKQRYLNDAEAIKNIIYWWSNKHYNLQGYLTPWIEKSKPIWFTEIGFSSVDYTTNSPYCTRMYDDFGNIKIPEQSLGNYSVESQLNAILGTILRWKNEVLIDNMFFYYYDIRPFPDYPSKHMNWNVSEFWHYNSALNGKINSCNLQTVLQDILSKLEVNYDDIIYDLNNKHIFGYLITKSTNFNSIFYDLERVYNISIVEKNNILYIQNINHDFLDNTKINVSDKILDTKFIIENLSYVCFPQEIIFIYIDISNNYQKKNILITPKGIFLNTTINGLGHKLILDTHAVLFERDAYYISLKIMNDFYVKKYKYQITLPANYEIYPNDYLSIENNNIKYSVKVDSIYSGEYKIIEATEYDDIYNTPYYYINHYDNVDLYSKPTLNDIKCNIFCLHTKIPYEYNDCLYFYAKEFNQNWKYSKVSFFLTESPENIFFETSLISAAICGKITNYSRKKLDKNNIYYDINPYYIDNITNIDIYMYYGNLDNISIEDLNSNKNILIVDNELIRFLKAENISPSVYRISSIIRGCFNTHDYIEDNLINKEAILYNGNLLKVPVELSYINKEVSYRVTNNNEEIIEGSFIISDDLNQLARPIHFEYTNNHNDLIIKWITIKNDFYCSEDRSTIYFTVEVTNLSNMQVVRTIDVYKNQFIYTKDEQKEDGISEIFNISMKFTTQDGSIRKGKYSTINIKDEYSFELV